jgi:hypothetical protein
MAVASSYGVPAYRNLRPNLYVTLLGKTRVGKSVVVERATKSWVPPVESMVVNGYAGSEIGLVDILGGKRLKADEDWQANPKPTLLVQDEMRMMFGKIAIQNSSLPYALNQLFYKDIFETASKGGHYVVSTHLSMLGCLTCANPDEFAEIYGVDTATGLYGRTLYGYMPEGYDLDFANWEPPFKSGSMDEFRRPKTCTVTAEIFRMADEWAKEDITHRLHMKELALRWALVASSMNHDDTVTEESMQKALWVMELQIRIRDRYKPSEMDSPSGKCQQAIVRALEHYEGWVRWRDLCRNHHLHASKTWDATVLNRVKRAMIWEEMIEEEFDDEKKRTGRLRLLADSPPTQA